MSLLITLFHLLVFIIDLYSIIWDVNYVDITSSGLGGRFKYLTKWNIVIQTVYFGLSFLKDLTEDETGPLGVKRRSSLARMRDWIHICLAWPLGMFVLISFWSLMFVDRDLVMPAWMDEFVPAWLNHTMHTTIVPFILLEKLLVYHHHSSRTSGMAAACGLGSIYIAWTFLVAYVDGKWIYPVLAVLSTAQRAVFIAACWAVFCVLYLSGEMVTNMVWKKQMHRLTRVQRRKTH